MRIYPEKGFTPTAEEYHQLAAAALRFGLHAAVGREKTGSGYRRYVELYRPVNFGAEKAAPGGNDTEDGSLDKCFI